MDTQLMCGGPFTTFMDTTIFPLVGLAAVTTAILIALSYMASKALSNPKLSLWAKTEIIQLGISIATIAVITLTVSSFCSIDISEIAGVVDVTGIPSANIFEAAGYFLRDGLEFTHDAMVVSRYQLEAYTVLSYYSGFICDFSIGRVGLGCWFGWGGQNMQPYGGYGAGMAALNVAYNGLVITYFTELSYLFILIFVYKGFAFVFLPVGIFVRCIPYMRNLGAVLISVSMAFMIVYPTVLAVFYLMGDVLFEEPSGIGAAEFHEGEAALERSDGEFFAMSTWGEDPVKCAYLAIDNSYAEPCNDERLGDIPYALEYAAHAYIGGGFFPTVALLATIASVSYLSRLYGDEIDLSKIVQMV
ncbi:MAG: hypothetical protein ABH842_04750 [Candidatus Micrarchaeota archaeon]